MASTRKGERKRRRARSRRAASNAGANPSPPPRFKLYGLGDLRDLPKREPLVEGLIDRETLATLIGPPESGKSAIALNMGVSIAAGLHFAGRPVEQGPVVYLAAEGQQGLRGRLEALCKRLGVELSNKLPFRLLSVDADLRTIDADVRGVISSVKGWLGNTRLAFLITDTLSATFGAGEENSSSDMMAYVLNVRRIMSELRSAALLVHHVPLHAQGKLEPRGHSSLKGNCETILAASKRQDGTVVLETRKEKDMATEGPIPFKLEGVELDPLDDGKPQQGVCALALDDTPELRASRLKGHEKTAFEVLRRLIEEGRKSGQNGDVRLSRWDQAFCASVRKRGQAPDTPRRAFNRARKMLEDQGIVRVSGDTARLAS